MDVLDGLVRAPFAVASAIRGKRIFHPRGVVAQGSAQLDGGWWPEQGKVPVTARLSRGIGLPGSLPDMLGLAVRFHLAAGQWDVLLVSSVPSARVVLWPVRSWANARYSSVAAYRTVDDRAPVWILAVPEGEHPAGADTATLAGWSTLRFSLLLARASGEPTRCGEVRLDPPFEVDPDEGLAFDPVLKQPRTVEMWPRWVAQARRYAYRGSRQGRPM